MKILLFSHRTPYPPHKGNQIRPFNVLTSLVARGHEVHLLAFADGEEELKTKTKLEEYCASATLISLDHLGGKIRALLSLPTNTPPSVAYFNSPAMHREVKRIVADYGIEAMVVYSSTMCQYVPPDFINHTVVDMADTDSEKWLDYAQEKMPPMSWIYQIEGTRLRQYEYWIVRNFGYSSLHTQREINVLTELTAEDHKRLIPITNGVDLEKFRPDAFPAFAPERLPENERRFFTDPDALRIVFTGAMDYYPNAEACVWFANQIFPTIRAQYPNAQFLIVGSKPTPQVVALNELPGVLATGFVDDVRPYLAAARVCVIPLRIARGVQNKALEAMASGRAVIATPDVITGVGATAPEHLLMARDEKEFAEAVLQVLSDDALRLRLENAARDFVERECSWNPLMARFAALVEDVGKNQPKTGEEENLATDSHRLTQMIS
ncbi:MAG: TIGR03087 family PEP-CTERM/XrtA system glycosyltransferase [Acidobacteria bacterium]|nr:TIGR03087 family PEP-CTERM/XrtA system glycosyltransferase [Acidobacteriota bacterium]